MHHDARVRQGKTLAWCTRGEQELSHRGSQPHAVGAHIARRILHGVVDRHTSSHRATWGVDVKGNVAVWVLRGQQQNLRAQLVRNFIVHLGTQEDDSFTQQTLIDRVAQVHACRTCVARNFVRH